MFVPGALYVKEHYGGSPSRPGLLSWTPTYAEIASGGDMGWTTGPWEWRPGSAADTPVAFGDYVTIWEIQPDSSWKFILDIGIAHGPDQSAPSAPALRVLDRPREPETANPGRAREELIETEYAFRGASESEGLVAAYLPRVAPDIRFYRMGQKPLSSVDALSTALSLYDGTWTWDVDHAAVARLADLGYTFGVSTLVGPETTMRFSFMHIWRRDTDGLWKLALDIHIPLPPETEETP
jgi:ketosteroid isomerase-like protein